MSIQSDTIQKNTTDSNSEPSASTAAANAETSANGSSSPTTDFLLTTRTAIETDWECGMKRFWYEEYNGKGIVPAVEADYFLHGRQVHDDFAGIVQADDPLTFVRDHILTPRLAALEVEEQRPSVLEPLFRHLGWVTAFALHLWPQLQQDWEVVSVEQEIIFEGRRDPQSPPLWCGNIPDLLLRHRVERYLAYFEYKTTKITSPGWMAYWPFAVQLHMGITAAAKELREPVKFAKIIGLYKGDERYGRLNHPSVWGWRTEEGEWIPPGLGRRGLIASPAWDYGRDPDSIIRWHRDFLPPEQLGRLFATSAPVFADDRLLTSLVAARTARELQVARWRADCRAGRANALTAPLDVFEPRFTKCRAVIGSPCAYLHACHNYTVNQDPLGSGLYVVRTPHHELELIAEAEGEMGDE